MKSRRGPTAHVRFGPEADSCRAAKRRDLVDQLVGEQLDRIGHLDAERPGGL
jgi:hypothetical protein